MADSSPFPPQNAKFLQDSFPEMLYFPARHGEFLGISMQSMAIFHLRHPEVPWSSEGSGQSGLPGCLDGWMVGVVRGARDQVYSQTEEGKELI